MSSKKISHLPHITGLIAMAAASLGGGKAPRELKREKATVATIDSMTDYFTDLGLRAECIHASGGRGARLRDWTGQVVENMHTENWMRDRHAIMVNAARGDEGAQAELAEIVRESVGNLLMAHGNWSAFFRMQTLADGDQPMLEFEGSREIQFETIGSDGGLRTVQADLDRSQAACYLQHLWSEEFEYPLIDLYTGDVASLALATIDVARDLAVKINSLLGGYMLVGGADSRIGAFTLDGTPSAHYVPHSGVHTSNLPITNLPTITGNTTTSLFRKEVFDAFIEYVQSWGSGALPGGDLQIAGIHVASKNSADWVKQLTLTSEGNFMTEQIFQGGQVVSYGGYKFPIIFDNTIPATGAGYAYLRTNKPVGVMFEKPGLDMVETNTVKRTNKGTYAQGKVLGFGMCKPWAINCAAVKFRDA